MCGTLLNPTQFHLGATNKVNTTVGQQRLLRLRMFYWSGSTPAPEASPINPGVSETTPKLSQYDSYRQHKAVAALFFLPCNQIQYRLKSDPPLHLPHLQPPVCPHDSCHHHLPQSASRHPGVVLKAPTRAELRSSAAE